MGHCINISKESSANGQKYIDRFIGVLCKESPDYSCETTDLQNKSRHLNQGFSRIKAFFSIPSYQLSFKILI